MTKIAAGIVTYNPDIDRLRENVEAVLPQVEYLYIIDNNSGNFSDWKNIFDENKVGLTKLNLNVGIARALNILMDKAGNDGYEWVLTLDDDSVIAENYLKEIEPYLDGEVGIACGIPIYQGQDNPNVYKERMSAIAACMTSGSVTNVDAWHRVSGYDEWMFIDFVDNDFCKRLELAGYRIIQVHGTNFSHQLGETETISLFGKKIVLRNYSPLRNYYSVRNQIYFIRKYSGNIKIMWYLSRLLYMVTLKLLFERNKGENLLSIIRGASEGFRKKI